MDIDSIIEEYEEKRRQLIEHNSNLTGVVLREKEQQANLYLTRLKNEFFAQFKGGHIYDIPVLDNRAMCESALYKFCSHLPKGAELHVHDMASLPMSELVPLLADSPRFCINADRKSFDLRLDNADGTVPEGYLRFCEAFDGGYYSYDELLKNWTVLGAEDAGVSVWEFFEGLFGKHTALSEDLDFVYKYYDRAFRFYCKNRVIHVEIHIMLTDSIDESREYAQAIREAYYNVKKDYPEFTVRLIGAGAKADNDTIDYSRRCFLNASYVQETVKDESDPENITNFLIGFDLVNEEDSSLPLKAFVPMLLKVKRQYPDMKLYIHGGESMDATNENLIDAYLLGAERVGHGLNLYRYPDLHARFVKAEICLEVCPVSNQRLGYTSDVRTHPATEYLRTGMAIALCSDDPFYMENETLTDDFFAALISWNLSLADLKQLGINSIMYSGLDEKLKFSALHTYNRMWNEFIDEIT